MSEPISTDDRAVGEPERLHPLFLLTGIGGALRGMLGGYVAIGYLAATGSLSYALWAALALVVFTLISILVYWHRFSYRVGAAEIRIDSGILNRTHRSIPFDRVQDVDITQGPVARLLGLAKVRFETGASAGQEEGVLQAIALDRAEALRELVRTRRHGIAPAHVAAEAGEQAPVYAMPIPRLLLSGVFNFSLAVIAALFGITQTFGDVIGFDPFSRSFWRSVASFSEPIQAFILANQVFTAIAGLLSLVAIGVGTGIIRTALRDYGFRLDRTESGLRRRRGLFTLTDVSLPVRRAQAAIVGSGPVRDYYGWSELTLQTLARDEGGSGDHVLAPLADAQEVGDVLEALTWRRLPAPVDWSPVSPAYVWVLALGLAPLFLLAFVQSFLFPLVGAAAFALLSGTLLLRWLAWRRTGYAIDGDRLLLRTGWWRRRTLVLPIGRIQSIDLAQNVVSRRFGVMALALGVAGGTGLSAHSIPALGEKKARSLRARLLSIPA